MRSLIALLIAVFPLTLFAQTNYHEGFVIKNNGDTLKGYIDYREWTRNPRSIDFKSNKGDRNTVRFNPNTIKSFEINGLETYITYIGLVSMDKNNFPDLPEGLDTSKKQDTVFLKRAATGSHISLYYQNDEIKKRYFVSEGNALPVELKDYEYYNEFRQVVSTGVFRGQLVLYSNKFAPANNNLTNKIAQLKFRLEDLEDITDKINNDKASVARKSQNRLFFGAGIDYTKLSLSDAIRFSTTATSSTIAPKVSFGIDFSDNPNVQEFMFRLGLSFTYLNPLFKYPVTISNKNTFEDYEFTQYTAGFTPQVVFNVYNSAGLKVFLDAGASLNLSFYGSNKLTVESSDPSVVNAYTVNKPYDLEFFWATLPLEAGLTLNKKTDVFFSYSFIFASYSRYASFNPGSQSMGMGVRFSLGGK